LKDKDYKKIEELQALFEQFQNFQKRGINIQKGEHLFFLYANYLQEGMQYYRSKKKAQK